jgi:hypothetical protein
MKGRRRNVDIDILRTGKDMDLQIENVKTQVRKISLPYIL